MDEIDWTAFYQWKSRQTAQLSLREEAEMLETFDNATDPESLEMDSENQKEGRKKNENHQNEPAHNISALRGIFRSYPSSNHG